MRRCRTPRQGLGAGASRPACPQNHQRIKPLPGSKVNVSTAVLMMAGNSCPPYGSSLAEAWDPSRILPLKQRTGGVVPEVLNRPAMGCDPFGIGSGIGQWSCEPQRLLRPRTPEGSKRVARRDLSSVALREGGHPGLPPSQHHDPGGGARQRSGSEGNHSQKEARRFSKCELLEPAWSIVTTTPRLLQAQRP